MTRYREFFHEAATITAVVIRGRGKRRGRSEPHKGVVLAHADVEVRGCQDPHGEHRLTARKQIRATLTKSTNDSTSLQTGSLPLSFQSKFHIRISYHDLRLSLAGLRRSFLPFPAPKRVFQVDAYYVQKIPRVEYDL